MKNPFKTVLDAFLREEPTNNKEIEEAEKAGKKAAEIGAKNAGLVPKAKVNEGKAAEDAKIAKKEQNTKGGEGR